MRRIVYLVRHWNGHDFGTFVGQREGNSDWKVRAWVGERVMLKFTVKEWDMHPYITRQTIGWLLWAH